MIEKYRDLSILDMGDRLLTIACDSCGGVGALEMDIVKASGREVGYYTALVPLIETIAAGSSPFLIIDTLSVSLNHYGKTILSGIEEAATEAGLDPKTNINGSSEEHFPVLTTGIGVVVLGEIEKPFIKPSPVDEIYEAVIIGKQLLGHEVIEQKSGKLTLDSLKTIMKQKFVLDVIPVGSSGILHEANQLARDLGCIFSDDKQKSEIIEKPSGPATCAVAAIKKGSVELLEKVTGINIENIGCFLVK